MSQSLPITPPIVSHKPSAMIIPISSLQNNGNSASLPSVSACHNIKIRTPFIPTMSHQIRARRVFVHCVKQSTNPITNVASQAEELKAAREDIKELITQTFCNPILVRLGWHDAGTFDKNIEDWPARGGANGSLRFEIELKHGANAGLTAALDLLKPIKDKHPSISWADLFQLASAAAIEEAGGPKIPMRYGRKDVSTPEECPPEGKLPDAGPPSPADHLRKVFYRMGLNDKEIVALSGAHTLGRARPERSGWGKPVTRHTKDGPGKPGGQSWTVEWLKFDNYYFKDVKSRKDADLLVLPTDAVLFEDPHFKVYAEKYAEDQEAFFHDYAHAHAKLSELGAKWEPHEGFTIDQF